MRSGAVGDSHRWCGCRKDWVEKQVRRPLRRARNRQGFGWQRWRRRRVYATLKVWNHSRGSRPQPKALPVREVPYPFIRHTQASAVRDIRMRRVTWRGLDTEPWDGLRHRQVVKAAGTQRLPIPPVPAPVLDPTGGGARVPAGSPALPYPTRQRALSPPNSVAAASRRGSPRALGFVGTKQQQTV